MDWEPYDPGWLVETARSQRPDRVDALARCTRCSRGGHAYLYFVDPAGANRPGAEWQFGESAMLEHAREGTLVLDVLQDGRIGGVEFLSRL